MTAPAPGYLEQAADVLEILRAQWARRFADARTPEDRAEVTRALLGVARGFAELAAVERGVPLYARPDGPEPGLEAP